MTRSNDRTGTSGWRRLGRGSLVVAALGLAALTSGVAPAQAKSSTSAQVVKVVTRSPYGKMLANIPGKSLYIHPGGVCTGSCLSVWPALLMPKGTTTPTGAKCLGTVKFGTSRLQVTYQGQRLYTYVGDSGTSVNGNGVGGFYVAKVSTTCP